MVDMTKVKKLYEETDTDIVNALLSVKKCILLATSTREGKVYYAIGYIG